MSNASPHDPSKPVAGDLQTKTDPLTELRNLLLGPIQIDVGKLRERLDDPEIHARDISRVLAEAIALRSTRDKKRLTRALSPAVEDIVTASLEKDRKAFTNALFPVLGAAVRKAIAEAFKKMIQSLNFMLERSLSWQGLMWRLEALRTGTPYAEVVLLHCLVYRVEQVFLIHRETGLVLQHVVAESVAFQDPDVVSGMLTAIQEFTRDSFSVPGSDALDAIQIGELTLWVERGPMAMLVAVIRGSPLEELRTVFQETLETIHLEQRGLLVSFKGDPTPFEAARPHLDSCLLVQYRSARPRPSLLLWILVAGLVCALGLWTFFILRTHHRWAEYVAKLKEQPGIVVASAEKRDGRYFVYGLRDPLAAKPEDILSKTQLDAEKVTQHWEPYLSLNHALVFSRTSHLLNPPETVSLQLEGEVLVARGSAPHQWIMDTRKLLRAVPGISQFQDKDLVDTDIVAFNATQESLEKRVLFFVLDSTALAPDQDNSPEEVATEVRRLHDLSQIVEKGISIEIVGHTDLSGTERRNKHLSQQRAEEVRSFLACKGIPPAILNAVGVGTSEPLREGKSMADMQFNRSVTFRVTPTVAGSGDAATR